ncbi:MAG: SMC-Scp complex subunit ScpB [Oscillospiraceae bacterium]|nr:SMC-Scp complex subunit ScpB [Oscillospiraceae bacterium]
MDTQKIESVVEGILFASGEPVSLQRLSEALEAGAAETEAAVTALGDRYRFERRGMRIVEMDGLFQMVSSPEHADIIRKVLEERKPSPLSKAALEVLSIAAYHQPVTRADIERIRGVDSSNTVQLLCDKELIEEAGRLDVLGRPMQFRTTPVFLRAFGLRDLGDLPDLEELEGQMSLLLSRLRDASQDAPAVQDGPDAQDGDAAEAPESAEEAEVPPPEMPASREEAS